MSLFNNIKDKLFQRKLLEAKQRSREARSNTAPLNPENAHCILILFPADASDDRKTVDRWADVHRKKGHKVRIAGFFSQDVGEANFGFPAISPKSLNWYGVPKKSKLVAFDHIDCDLLFRLGPAGHKELDYLATIKSADLKVGPFQEEDTPYHLQFDADRSAKVKDQLAAIEQIFSFTNASSTT